MRPDLSPEQWARALALMEQMLELPEIERAARLDEIAREDLELRGAVESLLASDARSGGFLEADAFTQVPTLIEELAGDPVDPGPDAHAGRVVGPYRLVREVGRGGMGVVYLAERADGQFEQIVALKLLRGGFDSDAALRRFRRERQILARLEHPDVARLLDGGVTEDGVPWFAMEYVEGLPITAWCDQTRAGLEDRLDLFGRVCRVVQFAHRNLVVHRDLKPSNILITKEGGLKLLDFGIARIVAGDDQEDAEETLTQPAQRMMTPQYAAPEQVRGEPTTTSTDVYALGLVLYEMLCGRRPYHVESRSPDDLARLIVDTAPPPPSRALLMEGQEGGEKVIAGDVARVRATTTDRLARKLAGDLDTIVLTALRKKPDNRYASVEAMIEDIRLHREGLPIRARRIGAWRRALKFASRHRVGLAVSATAVAVLAGWAVTLEVALERQRVERQRAERIQGFLEDLLSSAGPERIGERFETAGSIDPGITVREVLDRAARRIKEGIGDDPEVRASLERTIGQAYLAMSEFEKAEPLLRDAAAVHERNGEPHAAVQALNWLSILLDRVNRSEEALEVAGRVVEMQRGLHGEDSAEEAEVRTNRATILRHLGRLDEWASETERAFSVLQQKAAPGDPRLIEALNGMAVLRYEQGRDDESEALHRDIVAKVRESYGENHPRLAIALNNLATALYGKKRWEEAAGIYQESLEVKRRAFGPGHPEVATALNNIAMVRRNQGRLDEAEPLFREALKIRTEVLGPEHRDTLVSQSGLANLLKMRGSLEEAESIHRQVLAARRRTLGPDHPLVASSLSSLGEILAGRKSYAEAEPLLAEALEIRERVLPEGNPSIASSRKALSSLYAAWGRPAPREGSPAETARNQ